MSYVNHFVGPLKIVVKEAYTNGHAYVVNDTVSSGGLVYRCILGYTAGATTPDANATNWVLVGNAVISAVDSQSYSLGSDKVNKSAGGQVYNTFTGILHQAPKMASSTELINSFLAAFGLEGLFLPTGIEQYNQLADTATGKRSTGGVHEKLAFASAFICPKQLTCSHRGVAKLTFDIYGISSDGTTHPCALSSNVSLPTVIGVTEQYTLGPLKIMGTTYEGVQDFTYDFGLSEVLKSGGADIFTRAIYLEMVRPKLTIRSDDAAILAALALVGTAQVSTASVMYLAKCTRNSAGGVLRVANGTSAHISLTVNDGLWLCDEKGGSHPGALSTPFSIEPIYDGTHAPVILATSTTIS